ncbi:MAG TPA: dephospho-CoA kinase [Thermoclostridium sp.]
MLTIGLTGVIGSGKSTVARILRKYGAEVIFADDIAKEITEPGMPAYREIIEHFGDGIIGEDKRINRKKLAGIVFSNNAELQRLNEITHSTVAEVIIKLVDEYRNSGKKLVVVEAIVPIEHGFLDVVDTVWVVLASESARIDRIMERSGLTYEEAKKRIQSQMSDEMYISVADKIIYNDGSLKELEEKVWGLLKDEKYSPT